MVEGKRKQKFRNTSLSYQLKKHGITSYEKRVKRDAFQKCSKSSENVSLTESKDRNIGKAHLPDCIARALST
jgi:hypothetical protein